MQQLSSKKFALPSSHLTILQYNFAVKNEKQKKCTVRTIPQSNSKIDAPSAEIHDHPLSWCGTGTSVYMGRTLVYMKEIHSKHTLFGAKERTNNMLFKHVKFEFKQQVVKSLYHYHYEALLQQIIP
jgi:hypothetical protein